IKVYVVQDPTLVSTREYKLVDDILEAKQTENSEVFTDCVTAYDQATRLDNWKTSRKLSSPNQL
ncbi:hypothetical protein PISMIDRAFT_59945, partial [Pisolithus microcarpus 441]